MYSVSYFLPGVAPTITRQSVVSPARPCSMCAVGSPAATMTTSSHPRLLDRMVTVTETAGWWHVTVRVPSPRAVWQNRAYYHLPWNTSRPGRRLDLRGLVYRKIFILEKNLSSQITMVIIVFPVLHISFGLSVFLMTFKMLKSCNVVIKSYSHPTSTCSYPVCSPCNLRPLYHRLFNSSLHFKTSHQWHQS